MAASVDTVMFTTVVDFIVVVLSSLVRPVGWLIWPLKVPSIGDETGPAAPARPVLTRLEELKLSLNDVPTEGEIGLDVNAGLYVAAGLGIEAGLDVETRGGVDAAKVPVFITFEYVCVRLR